METEHEATRGKKLLELHARTLSIGSVAALGHIENKDYHEADAVIRAMHELQTRDKTLEFKIHKNFTGDDKEDITAHLMGLSGSLISLPSGRIEFPKEPTSISKIKNALEEIRDSSDQIIYIINGRKEEPSRRAMEDKLAAIKAKILLKKVGQISQEEIDTE